MNAPSDTSAGRSVVRDAQVHRQSAVDRAIRDLGLVHGHVVALACLRDPATKRPWREPSLDPVARAELDYLARQERAERLRELAPGEHADAVAPEVLDLLDQVHEWAVHLEQHISRACRAPILRPTAADPRPHLARVAAYLPQAVVSWTNGSEIAWWVADVANDLATAVSRALSLMQDGQRLKVICPWCQGRTEMAPVGGQRTWRVRQLPGNLLTIVCESGTCNPPTADVTTWWRGKPAWPIYEWDWLASRIESVEARSR